MYVSVCPIHGYSSGEFASDALRSNVSDSCVLFSLRPSINRLSASVIPTRAMLDQVKPGRAPVSAKSLTLRQCLALVDSRFGHHAPSSRDATDGSDSPRSTGSGSLVYAVPIAAMSSHPA